MPEEITRLSQLEAGKDYKMEADAVSCTIFVVRAGISPLCIVYGGIDAEQQKSVTEPIVMQLVGWADFPLGDNEITMIQSFMHFDEKPGDAWLIGAWYNGGLIITKIACEPTITEL